MPKKLNNLDHKYNEKLAKIRKSNVERHAGYENTMKLRASIQGFQRNATYNVELRRLRGVTAQGHIAPHAHKRIAELNNILAK